MKLVVLGAGPGGYVAALEAARLGARVTVIEADEVGGTCLNWGCIPTKSFHASARALANARELAAFGISLKGEINPDFAGIMERKNRVVGIQVKGIRSLFRKRQITLLEGKGLLLSPREVRVSLRDGAEHTVTCDKLIIATGAGPFELPFAPFDGMNVLSTDDVFRLSSFPGSLVIIGAGVSGCELAFIFREFGCDVTLVEMLDRAIATEDMEISEVLHRELKKKKIRLLTGRTVKSTHKAKEGVRIVLDGDDELFAEKILVSAGRKFNSRAIGLEAAGVTVGHRGEILVNDKMETNVPGIYAIGDVVGGLMLAHVASKEGIIAARNAMGGEERINYSAVPNAIFTVPEIASVGLREYQATERGIKVKTGHFPFRALGKSHVIGEIEGFIKVISDPETDKILGVHIIGPHASELIHEMSLAMHKGLTARDIAGAVHAHPTLSEALGEAAGDVHGEAVHVLAR